MNTGLEVILERIKRDERSSLIDKEFSDSPNKILQTQASIRRHLQGLGREHITLDTGALNVDECVQIVLGRMREIRGLT